MPEFSMPYQREREHEEKKEGSFVKERWRPLPNKEGHIHYNNVNLLLFAPGLWKIFNPTPDMQAKYHMNPTPFDPAQPIYTFFFKLPIHEVSKYTKPDGSVGFASLLCPVEMNRYLMEALGQKALFTDPVRCAFCEEEARQWEIFNAVWESLGIDRKTLSSEGYKDVLARTPAAVRARKLAKDMQTSDKYYYALFDFDKLTQVRPLEKDEDPAVAHQAWFAPKTVHEKLCRLFDGGAKGGPQGLRFFENTAAGMPLISIVKDTRECRKGNMRDTKYDAIFSNRFHQYAPEWLAYLQNVQAMVDPSDILVQLATYEEGVAYVASLKSSGNDYQAQAPAPQGLPPGMGMPPGMVPPGAGMAPGMGVPPGGMPSYPGAGYGTPYTGAPGQGVPPLPPGSNPLAPPQGAPNVQAPPAAPPAQQQFQPAPPPGMPQMAPPGGMPMSAPPSGMPPMAPPPGMPPQAAPQPAPSYGGAPVPAQPPTGMPPTAAPPVPTAPGFGVQAPPDRTPPATPPAGDGPPMRQW